MKAILFNLDNNSNTSLYIQLYDHLVSEITERNIGEGERLPSLRRLSEMLDVSVTTCQTAYDQLLVEGYIESKPHSGYYVREGIRGSAALRKPSRASGPETSQVVTAGSEGSVATKAKPAAPGSSEKSTGPRDARPLCDPGTFDFVKWKKCFSYVMNEHSEELLSPADAQGEHALRIAISQYLYTSRGVDCSPKSIVVAAGVQQLTHHIARLLSRMGIELVNTEDPGYEPIKSIFRERGFSINEVPVVSGTGHPEDEDDMPGICIEKLPVNLGSAVYVSPSNQFPTGAVMPIARRQELLEWAERNGSVIIEDDYDSELRYFGHPIPSLRSIDKNDNVVYLGSFSSTLFPAIKISYMVLPERMAEIYSSIKSSYDQTCSKAEQLTLARFMESGYYRSGIRKLRKLSARKLEILSDALSKQAGIKAVSLGSGLQLQVSVDSDTPGDELCRQARGIGVRAIPLPGNGKAAVYFDQIPLEKLEWAASKLAEIWAPEKPKRKAPSKARAKVPAKARAKAPAKAKQKAPSNRKKKGK